MRIEDLDKNFKLETKIKREGLRFINALEKPFSVHGLIRISDRWVRMPLDIAQSASPNVYMLAKNTSGGRVRFATDSPYIAIKAVQPPVTILPHIPLTGHAGFDLYIDAYAPITTLLLGGKVEIQTLKGTTTIDVAPLTQSNTKYTLKGKGVKYLKGFGSGDIIVTLKGEMPKDLDKSSIKLIKDLEANIDERAYPKTNNYKKKIGD